MTNINDNLSSHDSLRGIYVHYKNGQRYEVIGTALHTETEDMLVIYKPLYENEYELFARPYDMFVGTVEYNGNTVNRFQKVQQ